MDFSLPGSSVQGILQAKILEWIAISSSKGSSWPRDWTYIYYIFCIGRQVPYHVTTYMRCSLTAKIIYLALSFWGSSIFRKLNFSLSKQYHFAQESVQQVFWSLNSLKVETIPLYIIWVLFEDDSADTSLPQWLSGKGPAYNPGDARDVGSTPGSGRSSGGGNGNLLQYSCLENSMDRRA